MQIGGVEWHGHSGRLLVVFLSMTVAAATVMAAPQVTLEGEPAQPVELASATSPSGIRSDKEMRSTGDEQLDSFTSSVEEEISPPPAGDSRSQLRNELQTLLADLERLNELLASMDDSPELAAAREQMQQRLQRIRSRLAEESQP